MNFKFSFWRHGTGRLGFLLALSVGLVPATTNAACAPGGFVGAADLCASGWAAPFPISEASGSAASDKPGGTANEEHPLAPARVPENVEITRRHTWNALFSNFVQDQKTTLKFPVHLATGQHWKPFLAFTAITASLVALDPHDSPYFRRTKSFTTLNTVASGVNTGLGMALVPAAFYVISAKRGDSYGKQTVFLAGEAIADTQMLTFAMKMIDRRIRPVDVPRRGNYADTWLEAGVLGGKSFPSGHTMTAFALADIFTERYRNHRWIPWVAYGLATGVGFSRLTLQAHFPSDVFAGAFLGTVISHFVVLRR